MSAELSECEIDLGSPFSICSTMLQTGVVHITFQLIGNIL